jgi:hypothetical protein
MTSLKTLSYHLLFNRDLYVLALYWSESLLKSLTLALPLEVLPLDRVYAERSEVLRMKKRKCSKS